MNPQSREDRVDGVSLIGAGNVLMGDDGVGIAVLELLKKNDLPGNVRTVDVGSGGMTLLHALSRSRSAIIIDAVDFGGAPGDTRTFTPDKVESIKRVSDLSLHETDLLKTIELARALGECPERTMIFAIQPANIARSMVFSEALRTRLPEYAAKVLELVNQMGRAHE